MSDEHSPVPCGSTRFSHADQIAFASLSGDTNPLHVDPIAARRLMAGRQVVHGMHVVLRALEAWASSNAREFPASVNVDFINPVCIDDVVNFDVQASPSGGTSLRATVGDLTCSHIDIGPATALSQDEGANTFQDAASLSALESPMDLAPEAWVGRSIRLPLPASDMALAFPRTSEWIGERRVAALGLLSYIVGMVCPGLNSVFSSVSFSPMQMTEPEPGLFFKVTRFDSRYRIFLIDFDGCIRGRIKAFARAKIQNQPGAVELMPRVEAAEFAGTHSWVIGGSRGLGELTAKLVAAGGGDVTITYAQGSSDAERIVDEINAAGRGRAKAKRLDVVQDNLLVWMKQLPNPNAVFYYATPRIFKRRSAVFDVEAYEEFNLFYVRRFHDLCAALSMKLGDGKAKVFYPSSVAIIDRPRGMTEYAMSKAAAELFIEDWNKVSDTVRITSSRLPRLATDQTATVHAIEHDDNVEVLLPLVRHALTPIGTA